MLLFGACLSEYSSAGGSIWNPPSHGYVIQPALPSQVARSSGMSAKLSGVITLVGNLPWMVSRPSCKNNFLGLGCKKKPLIEQLAEDGLSIQAFFPDATTDVSCPSFLFPGTNPTSSTLLPRPLSRQQISIS